MSGIPYATRLSYAAPDVGEQLIFSVISNYLLYFYTDIYGIGVGNAGTILLICEVHRKDFVSPYSGIAEHGRE